MTTPLELDAAAHAVVAAAGDGGGFAIGRLAGRTAELAARLAAVRTAMTAWTAAVLAAELPTMGAAARARLASRWLPGRLVALTGLAGDERAAIDSWLARSTRANEARALLDRADRDGAWLALTPPSGSEVPLDHSSSGEVPTAVLWLLVRRGGHLLLEAVSADDLATYCFAGGDELLLQVAAMMCTSHFAREALYLPLGELTGERGDLAVAARDLPYLAALRVRLGPRLIHRDPAAWLAELDAATV